MFLFSLRRKLSIYYNFSNFKMVYFNIVDGLNVFKYFGK